MRSQISSTLVVAMMLVATCFAPVALAQTSPSPYDDKLSPTVSEMDGLFGYNVGNDVITSSGDPTFFVTVSENSKLTSLREWTNASSERRLLATNNESNRMLIAAPPAQVLGGFWTEGYRPHLTDGLQTLSYVESIDANTRISMVEPIDNLANASSYQRPTGAWLAERAADGEASFTSDGLAWDSDANESTIADARAVLGVDDVRDQYDGTGIDFAVVDSGCNIQSMTDDPLFQGRIGGTYNAITEENGTADAVSDQNGHGSWTCGALSADPQPNATGETYESIAPNSTLYVAKALDRDGSGSTEDIVQAIRWSSEQQTDFLSLSLGSQVYSATIAEELRLYLQNGGTAVFVAVGNSRNSPTGPATMYISSPADVPEPGVIGVASTNVSSPQTAAPSYYSETGPDGGASDLSRGVTNGAAPDVGIPGQKIAVPTYTTSGYRENTTLSGTSMSTPLGVGIAGLMLQANPSLENESAAFAGYYMNTSSRVPHGGIYEVGHGMPNAVNATSLTVNERTQEESRTDLARARDAALDAYSGSRLVKYWLDARGTFGGGAAA